MLSSYYILHYVTADLSRRLPGLTITEAFSQERDVLVLAFGDDHPALVISCHQDESTLYLHESFARARANTADVLRPCVGLAIQKVGIHPRDRIITVGLSGGLEIEARLFGPASNVLLLDADRTIVDAFRSARALAGGHAQKPPAAPAPYDPALLADAVARQGATPPATVLKRLYPTLGSPLAREIVGRMADAGDLAAAFSSVIDDLGRPAPRVYLDAGEYPVELSIIPLRTRAACAERTFEEIHSAIRFTIARRRAAATFRHERDGLLASLRHQQQRWLRTSEAIRRDLESGARVEEYSRFGTLLMANPGVAAAGASHVDLPGAGSIPLDPALTAIQNAERYFHKARRARHALEEQRSRLTMVQDRIARLENLLASLECVRSREQLRAFMTESSDEIRRARAADGLETFPFRRFVVDGGFEVWAGKSSENNDLLTLRHAKPDDLWFHARGAGGSHVVLRVGSARGEPGKKARVQAAGIAAYYSKMRNARMVPVVMTERRYVRKPRGAPAGTVALDREKVIFATPALPPASDAPGTEHPSHDTHHTRKRP